MSYSKICVPLAHGRSKAFTNECHELKEQIKVDPGLLQSLSQVPRAGAMAMTWKQQQSSQWKNSTSSHPKKARQVKSNVRMTLIYFFDAKRIVFRGFVPPGQTVYQGFYLKIPRHFQDVMGQKHPAL